MLLKWLRNRRRRRLLAEPFPEDWKQHLEAIDHFRYLSPTEQARARDLTRIFNAARELQGCGALHITDQTRVTVAGPASILVLGLTDYLFAKVPSILVYPEAFVAPERKPVGEVVLEDQSDRL